MRTSNPPAARRPHGVLANNPAIDANNRNRAEVAAAMSRMTQHMRPIGPHKSGDFHAIEDRIGAREGVGLRTDGVDASVGASTVGEFLNPIVNILLAEIQRLCPGRLSQRQPPRHRIDRKHPLGTQKEGAANRRLPDGPHPQIAIVSSGLISQNSAAMYPMGTM